MNKKTLVISTALAALVILQLYLIFSGSIALFVKQVRIFFLYMAVGAALSSALELGYLEFSTNYRVTSRRTSIIKIIGENIACAGFIGIVILPHFVVPLSLAIFAVVDVVTVLMMVDLQGRASHAGA